MAKIMIMQKIFIVFTIFVLLLAFFCLSLFSQGYQERGEASYYADKFHGRKTASGEIYKKTEFTAAHRTLPFGTKVKVTNLKNGKSVIVRINDRGPFKKTRIIDLSRAAAEKIDLIRIGVANVEVSTDENQPPVSILACGFYDEAKKKANPKGYGVQVGCFVNEQNAFESAMLVSQKNKAVFVWVCDGKKGRMLKVVVAEASSKKEAERVKKNICAQYKGAFIVEYKRLQCK